VQTSGKEVQNVSGAIKTDNNFMIGRFNYITQIGTFQTVGKIINSNLVFYQPGDAQETITSGAFEVLTCQNAPVKLECGALLQFTSNNITSLGFDSGVYYDNTVLYPGTGQYNQCYGLGQTPARITLSNSNQGQGAYASCGNNEYYDKIDPRFFAKHQNMKWVKTTGSTYSSVYGAIKINANNLYVGRVNITINNKTYQQIGKIWNGKIIYKNPATGEEIYSSGPFEILACIPCTNGAINYPDCCLNGGKGIFCCLNNANNRDCIPDYPCGGLISLKGNDPTLNGFEVGRYDDGSKIFAGVGNFSACFNQNPAPGRIMTTNSVLGSGSYCSCNIAANGENYDGQSAKYFFNHPDLKWVTTTATKASTVVGAIKIGIHYLGRKYLTSTNGVSVQVGKVEGTTFYYKHPNKNGEVSTTGEIDVLACVPCSNGALGPFCCLNNANNKDCLLQQPCGTLLSFPKNDPTVNGFEVGRYIDRSIIYAGAGDFRACFSQNPAPGRLMTTKSERGPGIYCSCNIAPNGEFYDDQNGQYFLNHPNLKWVSTVLYSYNTFMNIAQN
jgi:hypothetical protein